MRQIVRFQISRTRVLQIMEKNTRQLEEAKRGVKKFNQVYFHQDQQETQQLTFLSNEINIRVNTQEAKVL